MTDTIDGLTEKEMLQMLKTHIKMEHQGSKYQYAKLHHIDYSLLCRVIKGSKKLPESMVAPLGFKKEQVAIFNRGRKNKQVTSDEECNK